MRRPFRYRRTSANVSPLSSQAVTSKSRLTPERREPIGYPLAPEVQMEILVFGGVETAVPIGIDNLLPSELFRQHRSPKIVPGAPVARMIVLTTQGTKIPASP